MDFTKLLIAWALSMAIYGAVVEGWSAADGRADSGFVEALVGVGVLLAVPSFCFALIVGWPAMWAMASLRLD